MKIEINIDLIKAEGIRGLERLNGYDQDQNRYREAVSEYDGLLGMYVRHANEIHCMPEEIKVSHPDYSRNTIERHIRRIKSVYSEIPHQIENSLAKMLKLDLVKYHDRFEDIHNIYLQLHAVASGEIEKTIPQLQILLENIDEAVREAREAQQLKFDEYLIIARNTPPVDFVAQGLSEYDNILLNYLRYLVMMPSPSNFERHVTRYCAEELALCGFDYQYFPHGVMAVRGPPSPRGSYIMLSAHSDMVNVSDGYWVKSPEDIVVTDDKKFLKGLDIKTSSGIVIVAAQKIKPDKELQFMHLMGAFDDKCGLAIILTLARTTDLPFKVMITEREELVGLKKVENIPADFMQDVSLALVLDRKGAYDIVVQGHGGPYSPKPPATVVLSIANTIDPKYAWASGSVSDTDLFKHFCPAINLSNGSENAHRPDYASLDNMRRSSFVVKAIIESIFQIEDSWKNIHKTEMGLAMMKRRADVYKNPAIPPWGV